MDALPNGIHLGMKVYDNQHRHIGVVDDFRYSDEDPNEPGSEDTEIAPEDREDRASLMGVIEDVFHPEELPHEIRDRLIVEGYVRLDADGLFAADRYILPDQIAAVSEDELLLNVDSKDRLIKRV